MLKRLHNSPGAQVFLVALLMLAELFVLLPQSVQATPGQPGPFGIPLNQGYFTGNGDTTGDSVFQGGLHENNLEGLIYQIKARALNYGGGWPERERVGAQFIIQTMRGGYRNLASPADVADWEARVRYVASYGGIHYETPYSFRTNSYWQNNGRTDDAFFNRNGGTQIWNPWETYAGELVGNSITFHDRNGSVLYAIRRACANPVGDPVGLPSFSFNGESYIDGNDQASGGNYVTARKLIYGKPGETVSFFHFIRNNGGSEGTTKYYAWARPPGGGQYLAKDNDNRPNPGDVTINPGGERQVNYNRFTIPADAQPGQRWCQFVGYYPTSASNPGGTDRTDLQACVEVTYQYDLVPSVGLSKTVGSPGDDITADFTVNNGGDTASRPTFWAVKELVIPPGVTIDTLAPYTDNTTCAKYAQSGVQCTDIAASSAPVIFNPGTNSVAVPGDKAAFKIGNVPAGTRVCRILAIDPPTQNATPRDRWSRAVCVTIAKYPTVHFLGGDVSVGNPYQSASASCSLRPTTGNVFTAAVAADNGSIAEYAAYVRGVLQFQQSAARGFGTASRPAVSKLNASQLTFANTETALGQFGSSDCVTDYYQKFSGQIAKEASTGEYVLEGGERKHIEGDITIKASAIADGSKTLILVNGNVTIDGDIQYGNSYANTGAVPSLAIIATGDITIKADVARIDGVYSSKKAINTCDAPDGALTTEICNKQLVVNGAILTDKLNLRRTFGADGGDKSQPAEKFNYTTELMFNNVLDDAPRGRIKIVNERDLPPRFQNN